MRRRHNWGLTGGGRVHPSEGQRGARVVVEPHGDPGVPQERVQVREPLRPLRAAAGLVRRRRDADQGLLRSELERGEEVRDELLLQNERRGRGAGESMLKSGMGARRGGCGGPRVLADDQLLRHTGGRSLESMPSPRVTWSP